MPDEVIIDILDDEEVPNERPVPMPTPDLSADVLYQGEWELPDPYLHVLDNFTHEAHLDEVGVWCHRLRWS
eukprot:5548688-Amphidinium_carterae.2